MGARSKRATGSEPQSAERVTTNHQKAAAPLGTWKRIDMTEPILFDLEEAKAISTRVVGCILKRNRHGFLALRLFWNGMRSWEGTGLRDTPENRKLLEAAALVISAEIKKKSFDYLKHFPTGNKAHLFRPSELLSPSHLTVEGYYKTWIKKQEERHRPHRV